MRLIPDGEGWGHVEHLAGIGICSSLEMATSMMRQYLGGEPTKQSSRYPMAQPRFESDNPKASHSYALLTEIKVDVLPDMWDDDGTCDTNACNSSR